MTQDKKLPIDESQKNNCIIVGYHADCVDGYVAAALIAATHHQLGSVVCIPLQYTSDGTNNAEKLITFANDVKVFNNLGISDIYIVDFSVQRSAIKELSKYGKVTLIDHHETGKHLQNCKGCHVNNNTESGALATLNYLTDKFPWAARHISTDLKTLAIVADDYDRWQHKLVGSKEVWAAILSSYIKAGYSPMHIVDRSMRTSNLVEQLRDEGATILKEEKKIVDEHVTRSMDTMITAWDSTTKYTGILVECTTRNRSIINLIAHEITQRMEFSKFDFVCLWYIRDRDFVSCSIRAINKNIDLTKLVEQFGGGGHKAAVGCQIPLCYFFNKFSNEYLVSYETKGQSDARLSK